MACHTPTPSGTGCGWRTAAKAARWLGYIPFDRIVDQRNDPPEIREWTPHPTPKPWVSVNSRGHRRGSPDADDLTPYVGIDEFTGTSPTIWCWSGRSHHCAPCSVPSPSSITPIYICRLARSADTQAYIGWPQSAVRDGRPMVVFYFSDCDPAGWQMPISLSRKLQALKGIEFDRLEFQVHRVALTPDHVREYGLPSTPLKDTERRADNWQDATGVAQTEIDALAALQPDLLWQITNDAIAPFYDETLDDRVAQAEQDWLAQAQAVLDAQTNNDLEGLRLDAAEQLAAKREEIRAILDTVRVNADAFNFPQPVIPRAELSDELYPNTALCDSVWDFTEQCRRLIASKNYDNDEMGGRR